MFKELAFDVGCEIALESSVDFELWVRLLLANDVIYDLRYLFNADTQTRMSEAKKRIIDDVTNTIEAATDAKNFVSPFGPSSGISEPAFSGGPVITLISGSSALIGRNDLQMSVNANCCLFLRDAVDAAYDEISQEHRRTYDS